MEQLKLFRAAFLVSPTVPPGSGKEKKMSATYGRKCLEQLAKFARVGLWAKTFSALLIGQEGWSSTRCRLIWKLKGTRYSRFYFQLRPLALPTEGIEFGLWPTPQATERHRTDVAIQMKNEGKPLYYRRTKDGKARQFSPLDYAIWKGLIPTPTAMDSTNANGKTSQLNPRFVAEMMGFPPNWTELPFLNGETSQ